MRKTSRAGDLLTSAHSGLTLSDMGRRRVADIVLPEHVHRVKAAGGRVYFYYQVGRGKKDPKLRGARLAIAGNPYAPAGSPENVRFWAEIQNIVATNVAYPTGSIGALIDLYYADDAFTTLSARSQIVYALHLNRFKNPGFWGLLPVDALTTFGVKLCRDALKATPGMANQMLSVGRTLYDWAMLYALAKANPFDKVPPLETDDLGHVPWPQWALDFVRDHAPPDLTRLARLGVATCQRESDLIRLGPQHRATVRGSGGIWCRQQKTRRRRKSWFIPLAIADAIELDRWCSEPITFTSTRWKQPIKRHRDDLYLYSPRGAPYTPVSLRARYGRWLATPEGKKLCAQWRAWLTEMKGRYEWDVNPEDVRGPTIHGLRGTGILRRFGEGFDAGQISNDIGASRQTVDHYMRFKDQMEVAAAGRSRLRLIES